MSTSPELKKATSATPIPSLTFSTPEGKPYERSGVVEAEIQKILQLPVRDWMAAVRGLKSESLVFLIRYIRDKDEMVSGRLLQQLSERTVRIANARVHGVYPEARENIVLQVEIEIIELVLAPTVSRQSEFLEIAFGQAVARRTTDAVRKFRLSLMGRQGNGLVLANEDGEEIERPIEMVPDDRPSPEEIYQLRELIEKGSTFVKDPRHLEAMILRYVEGWPMTEVDLDKPCLVRHFQISARQIQTWINIAREEIREALARERAASKKESVERTMEEQDFEFDDVLDLLMLEEPKPHYQVLLRWQERFPKYKKELADFFATWAIQEHLAKVMPEPKIDEERLVKKGVEYAMDILRRQGRIIPADQFEPLTAFELDVLQAVYDFNFNKVRTDACSANVAGKVGELSGRQVSVESTAEALESLEKRHVLSSWEPDPDYDPEDVGTKYFVITMYGEKSLAKAKGTSGK
jgi:hypothetical protein